MRAFSSRGLELFDRRWRKTCIELLKALVEDLEIAVVTGFGTALGIDGGADATVSVVTPVGQYRTPPRSSCDSATVAGSCVLLGFLAHVLAGGETDFSCAPLVVAALRGVVATLFTTGEGPKALFTGAVAWLRKHQVLLPGVSTLTRLVARVRDGATQRLYDMLAGQISRAQAGVLEIPDGARVSQLERCHTPDAPSGGLIGTGS